MWEDNYIGTISFITMYDSSLSVTMKKKNPNGMKKHCKGRNFCCFLIVFLSVFVQANSIFP